VSRSKAHRERRVCFVTGTRAEFGLTNSVLHTIRSHPRLKLQIVATGMHLDPARGSSINDIAASGFDVDASVPWDSTDTSPTATAQQTGRAIAELAHAFDRLESDIVLVVGDRVEAFAGATAGHISGRIVAHVHGGDRALGQVDDSLRHAITKLAHVHFPATRESDQRILKLGEDRWRVQRAGSPGTDGIVTDAVSVAELVSNGLALRPHRFALLVLHPVDAEDAVEQKRAELVLRATQAIGFERIVIIHPNNDPGAAGVVRCWQAHRGDKRLIIRPNLSRPLFLGLLRDAAVLVGNSSSGIIEAASFGTPVVDIGPRQAGRERSANVMHVDYSARAIQSALRKIWRNGQPIRRGAINVYTLRRAGKTATAAKKIADVLAGLDISDPRLRRKLIAY
jgi:UDP-N-acetylglucosamine 2-epimerase (non-hydrolysing)/GDP/UDP-N,N'-diacetylbacillosamine 2-epimerase (hydrolysing)